MTRLAWALWLAGVLIGVGSETFGMALGHHLNATQMAYNYGGMAVGSGVGLVFLALRSREH
jgi:hypothetical protein